MGQSSALPLWKERFFFPVLISQTIMLWDKSGSSTMSLNVTIYLPRGREREGEGGGEGDRKNTN